ncbi:TIR domain-containing protein [Frankia sp. Cr1]|uniref:TIR domain-containing protein n=1 Tax=Frankia sp. Cr1 TaxID=3073931 RepID=UPI002AD5004C|nr:TIR domain-containing protein [Frankia sp. Cr1]
MVGRSDGDPAAFLSYAHADDEHDGGLITRFRQRLEGELRAQTGLRELQIFQDRADIGWGQAWKDRIDSSLDAVTFFVPIVTPAFLASAQCRRELAWFVDRERRLGRNDLILPVYWIDVPALDVPGRAAGDALLAALAARQYADWRELRFENLTDPVCRRTMADLAIRIRDALESGSPVIGPGFAGTAGGGVLADAVAGRPTRVHVVDALYRGDFTSVIEAVHAAQPGDRILVRPALYEGPIVLDKPVEVVGDGPAEEITIVAGEGSVVVFSASNGSVRGLTLRATGRPREQAVVDVGAGRLVLDGCDISGSGIGVAVHGGADPRVRGCRIHHTSGSGVVVSENGAGVFEDNEITGNT